MKKEREKLDVDMELIPIEDEQTHILRTELALRDEIDAWHLVSNASIEAFNTRHGL